MTRPVRPRIAAGALVALGTLAGARVLGRRRARRLRVDLYFEDGAMISLPSGSPEADAVLEQARRALAAADAT